MAEHVLQFGDGGSDWCIHCGGFDIYLDGECEAEPTGRFDTVNRPENFLRVYCDIFGDEGLTEEGRAVLAAQRAAA